MVEDLRFDVLGHMSESRHAVHGLSIRMKLVSPRYKLQEF